MDTYVYDKAKYHYDGNFPKELPIEQAFNHTGYYLAWIIDNNLFSEEFAKDVGEDIEKFRRRELTGPRLFCSIDGVLSDDMLSHEGNEFSKYYFDFEKGQYLIDYDKLFASELQTLYHVPDNWEIYEQLKDRIDSRYREWKKGKEKKRWWDFFR